MAIITEESDLPPPPKTENRKPTSSATGTSPPTATTTTNPFHFWFYFTVTASLATLIFISLSSLTAPQDSKAWFLSLRADLRHHYSKGRTIKVQTTPNQPPIEVFIIQDGPVKSDHILFVHGLGSSCFAFREIVKLLGHKGVHAVAIDLPGSGFSDKSVVVVEENSGGVFGRFWDIYSEIREKGLFWGFDQLVEQGYVNYEESEIRVSKRKSIKAIELGPEEIGKVLGQVIESMGLAPVDLVLHDSTLGLAANWVSENSGLMRSVMLLDSAANATALPLWVLEMPVVRELVLGFDFVFGEVLKWCCMKSASGSEVEAHRVLLKGRDGRKAVVGMGNRLNYSFDLAEWGGLDVLKALPIQVIWSSGCSQEWSDEGVRVANALPQAQFATHSGGRWPQEHTANEIVESIYSFISSLPRPDRQTKEEPIPEHVLKMLEEAKQGDSSHHHGHGHHGDGHIHAAGYMDAYGLGSGWAG